MRAQGLGSKMPVVTPQALVADAEPNVRAMTLTAMLPREALVVPMHAATMDQVLVELSGVLARVHGLSQELVLARLREREQLGSTTIGDGVALPHGRCEVDRTVAALGISRDGVQWGSTRVHVVVALLSPLAGGEHLRALARVGQLLARAKVVEQLRAAEDAAGAWAVLVAEAA